MPSDEAETARCPSGVTATARTASSCAASVCKRRPVAGSHILSAPSAEPEIARPSAETTTAMTYRRCPVSVRRSDADSRRVRHSRDRTGCCKRDSRPSALATSSPISSSSARLRTCWAKNAGRRWASQPRRLCASRSSTRNRPESWAHSSPLGGTFPTASASPISTVSRPARIVRASQKSNWGSNSANRFHRAAPTRCVVRWRSP